MSYYSGVYSIFHRFIKDYVDSLQPDKINRYVYCYNNPINLTDPLGLEGEKEKTAEVEEAATSEKEGDTKPQTAGQQQAPPQEGQTAQGVKDAHGVGQEQGQSASSSAEAIKAGDTKVDLKTSATAGPTHDPSDALDSRTGDVHLVAAAYGAVLAGGAAVGAGAGSHLAAAAETAVETAYAWGGAQVTAVGATLQRAAERYLGAGEEGGANLASENAAGFSGRKGYELGNAVYQPVRNAAGNIAGRQYTGHAFDQMQNRGVMPSVVENTIQVGKAVAGKVQDTTAHYDPGNNITVITDAISGAVRTVGRGEIKQ